MKTKWALGLVLPIVMATTTSISASASDITLNKKAANKEVANNDQCSGKHSGVVVAFDGTVIKILKAVSDEPRATSPQKMKEITKDVMENGTRVSWQETDCDANDWVMVLNLDANVQQSSIPPTITNEYDQPSQGNDIIPRVAGSRSVRCKGRGQDVLRFNWADGRGSLKGRLLKIAGDRIEFQPASESASRIFLGNQLDEIVIGDCVAATAPR